MIEANKVLRKLLMTAFAASLLPSCEANDPTNQTLDEYRLTWSDLADGSKFARHSRNVDVKEVMRCWPAGDGFKCINVRSSDLSIARLTKVWTSTERGLPKYAFNFARDGYHCSYSLKAEETIERANETLISNEPTYEGERWTAEYVDSFVSENVPDGEPYFDCFEILDALRQGSLETLSTTEVIRAHLRE